MRINGSRAIDQLHKKQCQQENSFWAPFPQNI